MFPRLFVVIAVLSLLLVACSSGGETGSGAAGEDSTQRGQALFEKTTLGPNSAPGCLTCHSREPGQTLVGPSVAGIAERAGKTVSGQSAEEYLHESIVNPDAQVVDGFSGNIMYGKYGTDLTEGEINDLVAYLMTLK
jgi:cytochrome c2